MKHTTPHFLPPTHFSFTRYFEESWKEIYQEYLTVKHHAVDWIETKLADEGSWKVFGLFNFPDGEGIKDAIALCPLTANLIHTYIPNHGSAGFSILKPHSRINPHKGYQPSYLRYHLGLEIPSGNCAIKVNEETYQWKNGESFIFDDHFQHEAWNLTPHERVILLVDFIP